MEEIDRITHLLKKHLEYKNKDSNDQGMEIRELIQQYPFIQDLLDEFEDESSLKEALQGYDLLSQSKKSSSEERMWTTVTGQIKKGEKQKVGRKWEPMLKYVAAACVLVVVATALWIKRAKQSVNKEQDKEEVLSFAAGGNKAKLELSDGRVIELSSNHQGLVVSEGLSYDDGSVLMESMAKQVVDLVLSTPKGGQYQLTLADGTRVWLNADSKLIYPNRFAESTRQVELVGEAYFEVAKNTNKPFLVKTASETVEVLGTHFNVNAYKEEAKSIVSLLEGSVKVVLSNTLDRIIKPGQQVVNQAGQSAVLTFNPDEVVAWKNGEFMFNNENLESVMRKIARWYDLDIVVSPDLRETSIWGSVSRYEDFSKVLKLLQIAEESVKFKIDGRRVEIMK